MLLNPTIFWLLAGAILCFLELLVPTAFVEFMMGLSAFIVAGVSLLIPSISVQVALWMIFSVASILGFRRLLPNHTVATIADAQEAETLTEILPGQPGRVIYEGNSWRAKCDDESSTIAANEKVIVVRREGNTLFVLPENLLNSSVYLPNQSQLK
ncbi:NfeD family protein [Okeania sp. SIO2B3]|uniref:NfeD family protein n=1 Tax=Okeania sp. SIO2B3 TaxID=2607784 RepID=UPI0013C173A3|nr:NfeD family protein [Okeania sp. SIO2B3]NET42316.1 NfeD family protein [Okeania sp. SIO2B3]